MSAPAPGPVALVGSGEFLPGMREVDAALLRGRPPSVVHLATAAAREGEARLRHWTTLAHRHYTALGAACDSLPVLTRADADNPALAARVVGAGLIYLSGGDPGYLATTLRGSAVWEAIVAAWWAGAALAGCSAGAMALGGSTPERTGGGLVPGLGAVPSVVVIPHFDRIHRFRPGMEAAVVAAAPPHSLVLGIDEDTALTNPDGMWDVRGRGSVWVLGPGVDRVATAAGFRLPAQPAIAAHRGGVVGGAGTE